MANVPGVSGAATLTLTAALATAGAALAIIGCGSGGEPAAPLAQVHPPPHSRIAEEKPPRAQPPYDVLDKSPAAARAKAEAAAQHQAEAESEPTPKARKAPRHLDPSEMPPASAGTNGSYTPRPASERETITPRTMAKLEDRAASGSAVLLSGVALAPPSAPERIKAAISAANEIIGRPYIWGGGHGSWYSRGYDCSGAVSYALAGGGFLPTPLTSSQLESWGAPGPGRWLTVYANAGHAYAVIAGLRWDTVGDARGTGPRWHPALPYPEGFVARHPPGF
jgi:cell wall-associated NlpC family hydrolase